MGTGDTTTSSKKSEKRKRRRRSRSGSPPPASSSQPPASSSSASSRRHQQQQPDEQSGSGGGEVISLSIEETNKLRAKLGLKPLEVDTTGPADQKAKPGSSSANFLHAPAKSLTQERRTAKVQERTLIGRQKREMRDKLTRLRGLGDDSDNEEDKDLSAAAWIQRSRNLEAERRLAEQRAKELAELDAEFEVSRLVEADAAASSAYSSSDLAGIRVAHSAKKFKEGQTTVLVLQDRGVLDSKWDGEDNGGETLINVNMVDDERHAENVRNRAQVGSAWHAANAGLEGGAGLDDDEDDGFVGPGGPADAPSVLAKYDSVIGSAESASRKRAFVLTGSQMDAPSAASEALLARRAAAASAVSLEGPAVPRQAADFLTSAEVAEAASKFKRRKRKVAKSRMLKADDLLPLIDEEAADSNRQEEGELVEEAPTRPGMTDDEIIEQTPAVADEALEDLQLLLERARRVQQLDQAGRRPRRQIRVAERRDEADGDAAEASGAAGGMVFDTTAEFCRSLGDASAAATAVAVAQAEARAEAADAAAASLDATEAADAVGEGFDDDEVGLDEDYSIYGRRRQVGTWKEVDDMASASAAAAAAAAAQQSQGEQQQRRRATTADDEDSMDVSDVEEIGAGGSGGGAGGILEEEPELRKGGVAAALELARRKGYLDSGAGRRDASSSSSQVAGLRAKQVYKEDLRHDDIDAKFGRRDRLSLGGGGGGGGGVQEFKELKNYRPDVKLEYTDDDGHQLNQKDAFDYLSHRFHGKGSGKKKTEKRLKKIKEEELLKSMGSSDTPLGTAEKLHAKLERQGTAYVCLSGRGAAASLPSGVSK